MKKEDFINKYLPNPNENMEVISIIRKIYSSDIEALSDDTSYEKVKNFTEGYSMGAFIDKLAKEHYILSIEGFKRKYNRQVNDFFYFIIRMMKYSQSTNIRKFLSISTDTYIKTISECIFPDIEDVKEYLNDSEVTLEDCFSNLYSEWRRNNILDRQRAQRILFYLFLLPMKYADNRSLKLRTKENT